MLEKNLPPQFYTNKKKTLLKTTFDKKKMNLLGMYKCSCRKQQTNLGKAIVN